jgi:PST family polysaccharide transporter
LLSKLRIFFQRPGARAAADNFSWLLAEKATRLVLGVGVSFWMARYLGPTQLGMLGYCIALVTLLGFLPALGLDAVVKRDLLQCPETTGQLLGSTLVLRLVAGGLGYSVVALAALSGWVVQEEESRLLLILGLLLFQPLVMAPDLWLQAHLRASWSVTAQLIALLVSSATRVWLIISGGTLVGFATVVVLEMGLSAAGVWLAVRHLGLRLTMSAAHRATIYSLLRESWPLMFSSLAIIIYMKIDEIMLRHLAGPETVGIYAAAAKLSEVWYFLPMLFASSILPALLRARSEGPVAYQRRLQQYYDLSAVTAYMLSIPIALSAPRLVRLAYGEAFAASGPILEVHIWASVFVFLGVARGQWLVNEKFQGFYLGTTVMGAVANILLNLIMIPRWGGLGAAYATLGSYALAVWLASFFHPSVRATAIMQTRALLIPILGWRYFRNR